LYDNLGDVGRALVGLQGRITENVGAALVAAHTERMFIMDILFFATKKNLHLVIQSGNIALLNSNHNWSHLKEISLFIKITFGIFIMHKQNG